jgi:hypothetical protein
MLEYIIELLNKPTILLTPIEEIILMVIYGFGLLIFCGLILVFVFLLETIKEKRKKKWRKD